MTYITNIIEPAKLWLMWRDSTPQRKRHKVGMLTKDTFQYVSEAELESAKKAGFREYPVFPMKKDNDFLYSNPLLTFISRCPPKSRPDYNVYLKCFGLNPDSTDVQNISDFALLGYTGAFLHDNPFTLVNDYADREDAFDFILHVSRSKDSYFAKHKYTDDIKTRLLQKEISFEPENHPMDSSAVKVNIDGNHLGYVQTGLTHSLRKWLETGRIEKTAITKLNGDASHPNVYAYVKIGKAS